MKIFFSCSQSTTNVALRFVDVQYLPGALRKRKVKLRKTFYDVFMYR